MLLETHLGKLFLETHFWMLSSYDAESSVKFMAGIMK